MLNIIYAEYDQWVLYADCHDGECLYAECRGTTNTHGVSVPALYAGIELG
jgi:hypothetical protein